MNFVVDKVAEGQVLIPILRVSPVSIMPPIPLHLPVALTRTANGQSMGTYEKAMLFRKSGSIG